MDLNNISFQILDGPKAQNFADALAQLRITVFKEFPYSYDGDLAYEKKYLQTYFKCNRASVILAKDQETIIGASTCIPMYYEVEAFKLPFFNAGYDPDDLMYYGESVILQPYRGIGIGKKFFEEREKLARKQKKNMATFCAVENPVKPPTGYRDPSLLWKTMGFSKTQLTTEFEWKKLGETIPTKQQMTFWLKKLF